MAKIKKGHSTIKGFIDGKSYYTMEGKDYVKNSSAPSKERLENDPAYAQVRLNYNSFGSASALILTMRQSLRAVYLNAMDKRLHGRFTKFFHEMAMASGFSPVLNLREHASRVKAFVFREKHFFDPAFPLSYQISCSEDRKTISLTLKPFSLIPITNKKTYSYFRINLGVLPFADAEQYPEGNSIRYSAVPHSLHGLLHYADSPFIRVWELTEPVTLSVMLPEYENLDRVSLLAVLHLSFYDEVNGKMYAMEGSAVMRVAEVY